MKHIKIANKKVGLKYPPFLIAEAGINHKGNLKRALKMIEVAKKAGVDAVKFQTFKADEFISNKKKITDISQKENGLMNPCMICSRDTSFRRTVGIK